MSKPEDIPQDVWASGQTIALEYRDWVERGNTTASLSDHAEAAMAETIARAILTERDRCERAVQFQIENPQSHDAGICLDMVLREIQRVAA